MEESVKKSYIPMRLYNYLSAEGEATATTGADTARFNASGSTSSTGTCLHTQHFHMLTDGDYFLILIALNLYSLIWSFGHLSQSTYRTKRHYQREKKGKP